MSFREEKEPNGEYAIVIDGWEKGVSHDPYTGMNQLSTVNLETPGEVSVGYPYTASNTSGGGSTLGNPIAKSVRYFPAYATPVGIPTGAVQSYAILDANGRVWESSTIAGTYTFLSSSNSTTGSTSNDGIAYWLGYLFKTRGANIDYWNGSTWSTGWQTTLNAGVPHFMYVGSDNVLYITNGNSIARVLASAPSSFNPSSGTTYAFSTNILSLPVTDTSISIGEVGGGNAPQSTLLIGGAKNAIYPWDKISSSFGLPIYVADPYIKNIVSVNQNAFIFPGLNAGRGRIYITNGSQADLYFKVPDYLFGEQDPYFVWGDAAFHRNNLLFGFSPMKNSGSGDLYVAFASDQMWALSLSSYTSAAGVSLPEKTFRSITTLPSNGVNATNAQVIIPATNPSTAGFSYIFASADSAGNYNIGYSATTSGISAVGGNTYVTQILTDRMPVGSFLHKKTFTNLEFKLRTPMAANEAITITPFTEAGGGTQVVFSPTPTTGVLSGYAPVTFETSQWLQFQIRLTGASATSGMRLKELRLR